ncbi:hypothetical protein FE782_08845 [Paenibacillus antri]|uniref:Serine protease n=1 Tax=Paenibacillus antri TaxID=2582848 RepID=A0A5R9GEE8_9BACL|nr:hypothetical protein [Paenibacillus antri]TLS52726.1 hypothetical protein FE782_08845 [Paenibacillus antri]
MITFAEACDVKRRIARSLLKHSKVQAVGIGYRDPKRPRKGAAILVYAVGFSPVSLGIRKKISKVGGGVPIRFVRTAKLRANCLYSSRIRPVMAGYSIGTRSVSGTLGLILSDVLDPSQRYMFSNNHVLTDPLNGTMRVATLQPGGQDDGRLRRDRVGTLERFAKLQRRRANYIDAAISAPWSNTILSPRYAQVGTIPGHVTSYRVGDRFMKVGQTTGLRYGIVESVNTDVLIDYGKEGLLLFEDQTIVRGTRPISLPGDSGSVWLRRSDRYAAAVNFAGTDDGRISVAFPVEWAMQAFRTRVARRGGAGRVRKVRRGSQAFAPSLTPSRLASIHVVQATSPGAK